MQKPRVELACDACGKPFEAYACHAKRTKYHFCSNECAKKPIAPIACVICGKTFYVPARGAGTARYCSSGCRRAQDRQVYAQQTGRYRLVQKVCEECKQPFQVPINRAKPQRFCSQHCAMTNIRRPYVGPKNHKWKPKIKITCQQCGKEFETYPSRHGQKFCSHKCTGSWIAGHCHSPTDIEVAIREVLQELGYLFKEQYRIGQWRVDFAMPLYWLAIECDGIYWHGLPHNKERDRKKDADLINAGWEVLRLPGNEIRKDLQLCIEKIEQAIMI